jgi:hypothetical protein
VTIASYLVVAAVLAALSLIVRGGSSPMPNAIRVGVLGFAALGLPIAATATPTAATLTVKGVPIPVNPSVAGGPTYPGTGNTLGAGTAVEAEYKISGTEYGGFPPPLTGVTFLAPAGAKLHTEGFATCPDTILEGHEVSKCPKKSVASAVGSVSGVVSFGGTRVHETLTLQAFFAPSGELAFFVEGRTPAVIEILDKGSFTNAGGMFGPKISAAVSLVETVPEAPYAVVESVKVKVGAAFKQGKKLISYVILPKACPKGGFPIRSELRFLIGQPVTINTKMPCPRK